MPWPTRNKYGAQKTTYDGIQYDSKFEASIAQELDLLKKAGHILDWERQFKCECIPYDAAGNPIPSLKVSHKVDFRVHLLDGTFMLLEAKGVETTDYRRRRKWVERVWMQENPGHVYRVAKANDWKWLSDLGGGK